MHGCPTPAIPDLVDLLTDDIWLHCRGQSDQPELLVMPGGKGEARHQELKGIICQANSACNLLSSVSIFSVDFKAGALPLTYRVQCINGVLKSCFGGCQRGLKYSQLRFCTFSVCHRLGNHMICIFESWKVLDRALECDTPINIDSFLPKYNTKYRPGPIKICWNVLFRKCTTLADVKFPRPCSVNHC